LVGAKWTQSENLMKINFRELRILIRDMLKMAEAVEMYSLLKDNLYNFSTITDIQKRHDEILKEYLMQNRVLSTLVFPDPPLAGTQTIIPITDPKLLFQEGIDQNNCVYSYLDEILAG
jgi:hypothetical protein